MERVRLESDDVLVFEEWVLSTEMAGVGSSGMESDRGSMKPLAGRGLSAANGSRFRNKPHDPNPQKITNQILQNHQECAIYAYNRGMVVSTFSIESPKPPRMRYFLELASLP